MSMIKCEEVCLFEEAFKRNLNDVEKKDNIPVKLETNFAPNTSKEVQDAKRKMLKDMHFTIRLRWQGYLAGMRKECR